MKEIIKQIEAKWKKSTRNEKLAMIISAIILGLTIVGVMVVIGYFIGKYAGFMLALVAFFLILFEEHIEDWAMKQHHDGNNACLQCPGCNAIYQTALQVTYQAVKMCEPIGIRRPDTPQGLITNYHYQNSGMVCCFFILFKEKGVASTEHSLDSIKQYLSLRINDASLANSQLFYGIPVQGFYVDSLVEESEFAYILCLAPICPCNRKYIEHRDRQEWYKKKQFFSDCNNMGKQPCDEEF